LDSTTLVIMGVAFLAGFFLMFRLWPAGKGKAPAIAQAGTVKVALRPPARPSEALGPTTLAELAMTFGDARLGTVTRDGLSVTITGAQTGWVRFTAVQAELVSLPSLSVETTSAELALLACDTAALKVGPMEVVLDGVELFVDGTVPRESLKRVLHDRQMRRAQEFDRAGSLLH